jgi:S-adenosyl-methyltransferase MraW
MGFDRIAEVSSVLSPIGLSGVLFDLGVSSVQLDTPSKGFSYRESGPIDMRMDRSQSNITAEWIVNTADPAYLAEIFAESGERRFAWRIAKAIERARPLHTTKELADVVRSAIPAAARRTGGHPAKRVFQALRVVVNNELEMLSVALPQAIKLLMPGGRCVVISYHSGEDRIVKQQFRLATTGGCTCPPGLPYACQSNPTAKLLFSRSLRPTPSEIEANPRARSARLRALEKTAAHDGVSSAHTNTTYSQSEKRERRGSDGPSNASTRTTYTDGISGGEP